ncbi:MAG: DUF1636 domain-containing protein [Alphaproteobacteria bacterium]|nr:DUF1636 domain-containing protein [Alphaproteobacteria bacterium]
MMSLYLQICQSCLPVQGKSLPDDTSCMRLQLALQNAGFEASVLSAPCLGVCSAPTSLTLQSEKRASYIFKDIDLERDQSDIIATCRLYLDSHNGWIQNARECGRLRHLLHAKIPAI